jgi:hypothetical protein
MLLLATLPLACAGGVLAEPAAVPALREAPPFERGLVLPGGGFQFAMFLGMLEGLELQGERPDVVVGSCGGGVAAAIATTIASPAERRALIESREFFEILRSASVQNAGLGSVLGKLWSLHWRRWVGDGLPNVFSDTLVHLPAHLPVPELDRPFGTSGIRGVIVAARVKFQPDEVGAPQNGRKPYQQVFFTDADTAGHLRGLESPIARLFPDSAVQATTEAILGRRPGVAARLSVADPFYVKGVSTSLS